MPSNTQSDRFPRWTILLAVAAALQAPAAGAAGVAHRSTPHPAVVRVVVPERDGTSYGSGTLVDVHGDYGLVITNWHVVAHAAAPPSVLFADGFRSSAVVVKTDRDWDLAALAIWKPRAQPVALSQQPPRPGQWLTIAGYGSGPYRAIGGACTQYLAPGTNMPMEMIELAAAARQGDSGGPILNEQGQLAGVLFGAGHGCTAGSYSGRVRDFLTSVLPQAHGSPLDAATLASVAAEPSDPGHTQPPAGNQHAAAASRDVPFWQPSQRPPAQPPGHDHQLAMASGAATAWPHFETSITARPEPLQAPAPDASGPASVPGGPAPLDSYPGDLPPSEPLTLQDLIGHNRGEQLKTLLAGLGVLALCVRARRIFKGS